MSIKKFKFCFYSIDATGHLNSAIGMAQALQNRGHEIIFISNEILNSKIKPYKFNKIININFTKEELKHSNNPAEDYAKTLIEYGYLSPKSSIEKVKLWSRYDKESLLHKDLLRCTNLHPQLEQIIVNEKPDCFVMDHVFYLPALGFHKIPFIAILSIAPTFLYENPNVPPALSGYSEFEKDESKWNEFHIELNKISDAYEIIQNQLNSHFNFVCNGEYKRKLFYNISPILNIYQYPKELDYIDENKSEVLNLLSVDAFIRDDPIDFIIPEQIKPNREAGEKLIFFSLGSMGGIDVDLMTKILSSLSRSQHKFIISKGPIGSKYSLSDNMWGENFLPQTKILPLVDLVITHGGNNTIAEIFTFGKPMIVMPLFADQFDNAQRIVDKGFGIRIEPYEYDEDELHSAIDRLLSDEDLKEKLEKAKIRIAQSNSKILACERIESRLAEFC